MNKTLMTMLVLTLAPAGPLVLATSSQDPAAPRAPRPSGTPGTPGAARAPTPTPGPAAPGDAITRAREDLLISRLTFERIRRNLEQLRRDPSADPAVLRDYSVYLETVRSMMQAHQRALDVHTASTPGPLDGPVSTRWTPVEPGTFDAPVPRTPGAMSLLNWEFDDALEAFDAFILEQQYEARRRRERRDDVSSEELTGLAREAAAAVERLRDKGIEIDTSNPGGRDGAAGAEGTSGPDGARGDPGAAGGTPPCETRPGDAGAGAADGAEGAGEGAGGSRPGEQGSSSGTGGGEGTGGAGDPTSGPPGTGGTDARPPDPPQRERPPAADDDIVARQLREAAERETDPVLKEKLWEEYERYKRSS